MVMLKLPAGYIVSFGRVNFKVQIFQHIIFSNFHITNLPAIIHCCCVKFKKYYLSNHASMVKQWYELWQVISKEYRHEYPDHENKELKA
jgi:hypothetical protein